MTKIDPAKRAEYNRRQRAKPESNMRQAARMKLSRAVRDGRLTTLSCEKCGAEPTQAHHDDYSKPLVVRWLCARCHQQLHHPRIPVRCVWCGKVDLKPKSRIHKDKTKRFCSAVCKDAARVKIVSLTCAHCGVTVSGTAEKMKSKTKYCGRKCAYDAMAPMKAARIAPLAKMAADARWRK
jgi:ribosomal protein S27AE